MKNVKSVIFLTWILDLCRMAAFGNGDDYGGDIGDDGDNDLSLIRGGRKESVYWWRAKEVVSAFPLFPLYLF